MVRDGSFLNADTKGDFLELTLAAAAQVLDCAEKPCSEPLMRCLRAARLLIEDAAAVGQPAPAESDAGGRRVQRQLQVLPKVRRRSLRAVAVCHVGRLIGRRRSACLLRKKCPRRVRNWKQACPIFSGPARVEFGTGNRHVLFFFFFSELPAWSSA